MKIIFDYNYLRAVFFIFLTLMTTGCTFPFQVNGERNTKIPVSDPKSNYLPVLGLAPEITNENWLNTKVPLRLDDLRGKVVLIEMWTFG